MPSMNTALQPLLLSTLQGRPLYVMTEKGNHFVLVICVSNAVILGCKEAGGVQARGRTRAINCQGKSQASKKNRVTISQKTGTGKSQLKSLSSAGSNGTSVKTAKKHQFAFQFRKMEFATKYCSPYLKNFRQFPCHFQFSKQSLSMLILHWTIFFLAHFLHCRSLLHLVPFGLFLIWAPIQ